MISKLCDHLGKSSVVMLLLLFSMQGQAVTEIHIQQTSHYLSIQISIDETQIQMKSRVSRHAMQITNMCLTGHQAIFIPELIGDQSIRNLHSGMPFASK